MPRLKGEGSERGKVPPSGGIKTRCGDLADREALEVGQDLRFAVQRYLSGQRDLLPS